MSKIAAMVERRLEDAVEVEALTLAECREVLSLLESKPFGLLLGLHKAQKFGVLLQLGAMPLATTQDLHVALRAQGRIAGIDDLAGALIDCARQLDEAAEAQPATEEGA